jgi:hypothetical protein
MKRTKIELSVKLRIKTLKPILEGKSLDEVATLLDTTVSTVKYRLTQMYVYYGVKNRYELMALYIKLPSEIYRHVEEAAIDKPAGKKERFLYKRWKEAQ